MVAGWALLPVQTATWQDNPEDYRLLGQGHRLQGAGGSFALRHFGSSDAQPLVIDLHQWNSGANTSFGDDYRLDLAVLVRGWNYVRPFLGNNRTPEGCCSPLLLERIDAAIAFAKENGNVDEDAIYVVGASGGGYLGLCVLMQGQPEVDAYNLWVPIADLAAWHDQTRGTRYAQDIMACTSSADRLDVAEAKRRSPLFMEFPQTIPDVQIYAGINDGWFGAVPITHSIRMFNRLATGMGDYEAVVDDATVLELLETRGEVAFVDAAATVLPTQHFATTSGPVELNIVEGAHFGSSAQVLADIDALRLDPEAAWSQ